MSVPESDPRPTPLRVCGIGITPSLLEEAARHLREPVQVVDGPAEADALLSVRGHLGRHPEQRRRAQALGLPILVIKSDSLHQLERALQRLLERRQGDPVSSVTTGAPRDSQLDDVHAALEECRLAVEQVVVPQGRPVELLPRSERVRGMQEELVSRYRLQSSVFGRGLEQRLRIFPA